MALSFGASIDYYYSLGVVILLLQLGHAIGSSATTMPFKLLFMLWKSGYHTKYVVKASDRVRESRNLSLNFFLLHRSFGLKKSENYKKLIRFNESMEMNSFLWRLASRIDSHSN